MFKDEENEFVVHALWELAVCLILETTVVSKAEWLVWKQPALPDYPPKFQI